MSEYQTSAVLPDGRLVRAAFGIVVDDPHTGNVLQSFGAPDPDDDMAMSAEDDPDEPTTPTPPSTLDRPPSMFSVADFESVDNETLRADTELALGTQRALQDSIGWGGTVYLLARRPASPLSRKDVVRIARWLYHEHDVLVDRVGYARQAAPGGEQYEWFLRIDQIDGASTTDTRRSMDKLRTRGVTE